MMRHLIYIALIVLPVLSASAQQLPQFSGWQTNPYVLNPAVTGSEYYMDAHLHYRKQWSGFENAPSTSLLSVHSSFDSRNFGLGGMVFNDKNGITKNTGGALSYAYHAPVGVDARLGFGLSGSFSQWGVDGSLIQLDNNNDNLVDLASTGTGTAFNTSFGMLLHHDRYYVGGSALNLLKADIDVFDESMLTLATQYYGMAGVHLIPAENWTITPAVLVSVTPNLPTQVDTRVTVDYYELVQLGIGYRTDQALILGAGVGITPTLSLNYNYDLVMSPLKSQASGSHEIQLSYFYYYSPIYKKSRKRYNLNLGKKKKDED